MKKVNTCRKAKGFTLVELVIVIAVIAVLSAVLIPVFGNVVTNAKVSALRANIKTLNTNLLLRSLNEDNRTSYSADEINQILDEFNFDRSNTPSGYSVWYDKSINNVRLFKNDQAFSVKDPSATESGIKTVYANSEIEVGNRPVEALNPYNRNLYYIDKTNKEVNTLISELKGDDNGGLIAAAEKKGKDFKEISALISSEYTSRISKITTALGYNQNELLSAFDIDNTLFIGEKGMYIPAFDRDTSTAPIVYCTNSFVDTKVTIINADQKLSVSDTKKVDNLSINLTITIPSKVQTVYASAFSALGSASKKINLEIDNVSKVLDYTGSGAKVVASNYSTILNDDYIKFNNANITFGTDYACDYSDTCRYFYVKETIVDGKTKSEMIAGSLGTGGISSLSDIKAGANEKIRVKYLVPSFEIKTGEGTFFSRFTSLSDLTSTKVYINDNPRGDLVEYNAVVLTSENNVVKGYKFSNIGYIRGVDGYSYESYQVYNHTGKVSAFPKNDAQLKIAFPDNALNFGNYKDADIKVTVTYRAKITNYTKEVMDDGLIYYVHSNSEVLSEPKTVEVPKNADGSYVLTIGAEDYQSRLGDYSTLNTVIDNITVSINGRVILVKDYNS